MTAPARLPDRIRVFELAKHLGIPAAALLSRLQHLDVDAQTVLKVIDRESMRLVLEDYRTEPGDSEDRPSPELLDEMLAEMSGTAEDTVPDPVDRDVDATGDEIMEEEAADQSSGAEESVEVEQTQPPTRLEHPVIRLAIASESVEESDEAIGEHPLPEDGPGVQTGDGDDHRQEDEPAAENGSAPRYGRPPAWSAWGDASSSDEPPITPDDIAALRASAGPVTIDTEDEPGAEPRRGFESGPTETNEQAMSPNLRKRILTVAAVIVLGTVALSMLYAFLRPTYAAESDLVIGISGLGSEEIGRELQSFAVLAENQTVLAPVAADFEMTVAELRKSFESEILGDSRVLRFTTIDRDPDTALALNQAIVASYVNMAKQPVELEQLDYVHAEIAETEQALSELDAQIDTLQAVEATNAATRLQLESERGVAQARLAELEGRVVDLRASEPAAPSSISFVENQLSETEARLEEVVAEAQSLESADAETRSEIERLREERSVVRSELRDFNSLQVDFELEQIRGNRVALLAPGHPTDDAVGLTPTRAVVLGLLVGGFLSFGWVIGATQLRRKR